MKISESTSVAMPIKNLIWHYCCSCYGCVGMGRYYKRLTSLETSKQLMEQDLLEASTQKPIDQEQFMLLEMITSSQEKIN